jgi:3-oxoacyl-[acyl-carrier protein] reductase
LLRKNPPGLVVNVASIAAATAVGSSIAYCASKAGLVNMTRSLARALAPDIRVNSVSPGLTDTELTREWKEYRRRQIAQTPMGRLGTVHDVARCVLSLACDMKFVTGHDIVVDGGRILGKE